ncbi:protein disulfide isomerase [Martiniozyma asiatica (nom. inval.)]|nr:protein disulfide isomerase [Martiniozyma asiatica]
MNKILLLLCLVSGISARQEFYRDSKYVQELTPAIFEDYIYSSNHSTLVEFYAPWCGYCQQMKMDYKKAAAHSSDFAQFAAVNCDEEKNKPLCAKHNIKGFPTVIAYRPPKTFSTKKRSIQFTSDVYRGERDATGLINFAKGTVKNLTKKVKFSALEKFTAGKDRVLLVTNKRVLSPMYKGLAIDFLNLELGYVVLKDTEKEKASQILQHELADLPMIFVIDNGSVIRYNGAMKKDAIAKFLTSYSKPNDGFGSERALIKEGIKSGKYKSFKNFKKIHKNKKDEL